MEITADFIRLFLLGLRYISPLLLILLLLIVLLGQIAGRYEGWAKFDAVYWACVTALTVGYGDFHPRQRLSKGLAVLIALVGVIFTGLVVAVALHAAQTTFKKYI